MTSSIAPNLGTIGQMLLRYKPKCSVSDLDLFVWRSPLIILGHNDVILCTKFEDTWGEFNTKDLASLSQANFSKHLIERFGKLWTPLSVYSICNKKLISLLLQAEEFIASLVKPIEGLASLEC